MSGRAAEDCDTEAPVTLQQGYAGGNRARASRTLQSAAAYAARIICSFNADEPKDAGCQTDQTIVLEIAAEVIASR